MALLHDWLKFTKPTGEFEFNSLQKSVNCEPNLFSVSPPESEPLRPESPVLDRLAALQKKWFGFEMKLPDDGYLPPGAM